MDYIDGMNVNLSNNNNVVRTSVVQHHFATPSSSNQSGVLLTELVNDSSGLLLLLKSNLTSQSNVKQIETDGGETRITLYVIIFVLSVLGNGLVIATCVQNKRMRTVTNVLLLNLAISDLLLSVFCMPFTLVGALLREFVFGAAMCKLIPFLQAVSVSVGVWTLVTISLERYFAICQPLRSRRWQTLSHIYKMIVAIWFISFLWMLPIAFMSQLLPIKNTGKHKCREVWPSLIREKVFTIFLDFILLVIPLVIMILAYYLISKTLYQGMQQEMEDKNNEIKLTALTKDNRRPTTTATNNDIETKLKQNNCSNGECNKKWTTSTKVSANCRQLETTKDNVNCKSSDRLMPTTTTSSGSTKPFRRIIRRTNLDKSLAAKRRVIRMLFVVVLEFFVCWTPLYVINTLSLFDPKAVYNGLGYWAISLVHLLAYVSSCCNPITYCFMHKKFRQGFLTVFGCRKRKRRSAFGRDVSGNDSSFYFSRQSTFRTEIPYNTTTTTDKGDDYRPMARLFTSTTDKSNF